jgi:hypothetical protein
MRSIPLLTEPWFIAERNLACENNRLLLLRVNSIYWKIYPVYFVLVQAEKVRADGILTVLGTNSDRSRGTNWHWR